MKKKETSNFKTLLRLLSSAKKRKKSYLYFVMILEMISFGLIPVISVFYPKVIIDFLVNNGQQNEIIRNIIIITSISLGASIVHKICSEILDSKILSLRMDELVDLAKFHKSVDYFHLEDSKFSDYFELSVEALNSDGLGFQGAILRFKNCLPLVFSTILFLIIICFFRYWLAIYLIVSSVIVVLINKQVAKYIDKKKDTKAKAYRQLHYYNNVCFDFFYGKDIRINNLSKKLIDGYNGKTLSYVKVVKDIQNKQFLYALIEVFLLIGEDALAYYFIISSFFNKIISMGDASLYIGIIVACSTCIRGITNCIDGINNDMVYVKHYFSFLDNKNLLSEYGTKTAFDKFENLSIEFKDVSFKYPGTGMYIYKNFNFKIEKGEKLAIVGINGAGKSTLVKLMTGLFDVTSGSILINGQDIKEFKKDELAKMFSVVFQEVNIYACSVLENVMGSDSGEDNERRAKECLSMVGLKEKIESLKDGYNTQLLRIIEEDGIELSGGQNQKIAIARALYKNANIIILDEPTASLDALAEQEIYHSFDELVKDKTAVYISHRLSSTKFCDKIALFSKDGLLEYGSHEELMKLKGEYYNMFKIQGKYYTKGEKVYE